MYFAVNITVNYNDYPLNNTGNSLNQTEYSSDVGATYKDLTRYLFNAYASYCTSAPANLWTWNCYWCNKSQTTTVATTWSGGADMFGYMAVTPGEIWVSFRGTVRGSIRNWIQNLEFAFVDYPYCVDCEVHSGFYEAYLSVSDIVTNGVLKLSRQYPGYKIRLTGHSLGGALATLAAANLSYYGLPVTLVTFGSPRVGNSKWSRWFSAGLETVNPSSRVTNQKDIVPHLPPQILFFTHICTELWFPSSSSANFRTCDSSCEDKSCSDGSINTSIDDHLTYLGYDLSAGKSFGC